MIKYQHLGPVSTIIWFPRLVAGAFQVALVVKNPPANAGDLRDSSWIPGLGIFPGEGHGNPLQYSCLENPMDRGAEWATVHRITKSQTQLKGLSKHTGWLLWVADASSIFTHDLAIISVYIQCLIKEMSAGLAISSLLFL